ncbi:hypothetical protein ACQ4M4_22210 [Leptolyngbya sp. AN02str]
MTDLNLLQTAVDRSFFCCTLTPDGKTAIAGDYGSCVHFFRVEE